MATLGPNDLKSISLPANWDAATLRSLALRDGTSYLDLVGEINDALVIADRDVKSGPLFDMVFETTEPVMEYRVGSSKTFERHTEYAQPDSQRADTTGHMLPIYKDDHKLGWTADFLEEARASRLTADIAASAQAYKDTLEKAVLTRIFKATADTGAGLGLGTGGKSVPFADGGTADANYIPVQRPDRAGAFAAAHTHYAAYNGVTQANLELAATHLWEHGHDAPFDLLVASADIGDWVNTTNVTGFVPRNMGLVAYGTTTATAQVDDRYQGVITTRRGPVRLWSSARIPTKYWTLYKSYGRNDSRNPLAMRVDPLFGTAPKLIVENVSRFPLAGAIVQIKYGIGVGEDRTSAMAVFNDAGGTYVAPTIS